MGIGAALATPALGVPWLGARRARAGSFRATRKLVVMVAYGGWDTTWALNPKPDSPEVDLIPGDVQMFGELPVWTDASRPAVTEFFTQWSDRTAIINGLSVDSLAHETCAKVMLTGGLTGGPDLGARVAAHLGSHLPLPYLALSPHAKTRGHEAITGQLGDSNQLMALATPEFGWPAPGDEQPDVGLGLGANERGIVDAYLEESAARQLDVVQGSARSEAMMADYASALRRADQIQASARQGGLLSDYALFQEYENPWEHVARALAENLSQVALVQPQLYWDTHFQNSSQGQTHDDFFAGLGALMSALATHGVVDDTVVLVISEMGRTPRHNSIGGKDHWPWTSAMLIGPGVNGGRAYGVTDEWLKPSPVDLMTGAPAEGGVTLHAEHVLHAAAEIVGADGASGWFSREALRALQA